MGTSGNGLDFLGLADFLLSQVRQLLPEWLPGGKLQGKEFTCGSLQGEQGTSLKINIQTGRWADFATNDSGGDLTSLYAAIHNIGQFDAGKKLAALYGYTPGTFSPMETPTVVELPPKLSAVPSTPPPIVGASHIWCYRSPDGHPIYYVARVDTPQGKQFVPYSWNGTAHEWQRKSVPAPRPLYNLDKLAARPEAPVLLTEGEKACDAAEKLLGNSYVCVTWPNGANSLKRTDFRPIYGRKILIWPDADAPGATCAQDLIKLLSGHCPEIKAINPEDKKDGWDAADAVTQGWTRKDVIEWARLHVSVCEPVENPVETPAAVQEEPQHSQEVLPPEPEFEQSTAIVSFEESHREPEQEPELPPLQLNETPIGQLDIPGLLQVTARAVDPYLKRFQDECRSLYFVVKDQKKMELALCPNWDFVASTAAARVAHLYKQELPPTVVKKILDVWKIHGPALPLEPVPFAWGDQQEWTYKKLDFVPTEGPLDAWAEFLLRLTSADEFMAFIWSIFEMKNESRQFLYLFDEKGEGGKSTVFKVLADMLGNAFGAITNAMVSGGGSRWLVGTLYGKRLAAWADCKNPQFCMSEVLRNMTSGDNVTVEFKGQQPFTVPMYVKLMVGSNLPPQITGAGADMSRLIRIDLSENPNKSDTTWKNRLKAELPFFLYACRQAYERLCPNHGKIELTEATKARIQASTESIEAHWEDIAHRRLAIDSDRETTASEWLAMCRQEKLTDRDIGHLKEYLHREHGVLIKRQVISGRKVTRYMGFTIKDGRTSFGAPPHYQQ